MTKKATEKKSTSRLTGKTTLTKNADGTTTVQKGGEFAGKLPSNRAKKAPTVSKVGPLFQVIGLEVDFSGDQKYVEQLPYQAAFLIASNARTAPELLVALAQHPETENPSMDYDEARGMLKYAIAQNPNTPDSILKEFYAKSLKGAGSDQNLVKAISGNPQASKGLILDIYRNEKDYRNREMILSNPSTPAHIVHTLVMNSPNQTNSLFYNALANPNINDQTLQAITLMCEPAIRKSVASHANSSNELLTFLSGDSSESVSKIALEKLAERGMLAEE